MTKLKALFITTLLSVVLTIAACVHDSDAAGGPTQAQFDALAAQVNAQIGTIDDLTQRLNSVEAVANADVLSLASAGGSLRSQTMQVSGVPGVFVGTLTSMQTPGPAYKATTFEARSATGYEVSITTETLISGPFAGSHLIRGTGTNGTADYIYFASNDCSGQGYIGSNSGSIHGAEQGFVFRINAGALNATLDDLNQYWYVAKSTELEAGVVYASAYKNIDECELVAGTLIGAFQANVNAPLITGVPSAPIQGPLILGETP